MTKPLIQQHVIGARTLGEMDRGIYNQPFINHRKQVHSSFLRLFTKTQVRFELFQKRGFKLLLTRFHLEDFKSKDSTTDSMVIPMLVTEVGDEMCW